MSKLNVHSVLEIPDSKNTTWKTKTLKENIICSYNQQLFVDAEIRVRNKIFKAHKCILAFYSPLFQKAFYGIKTPTPLCVVNDVTPGGFDFLLRFIYTSELTTMGLQSNHVVDACVAAQILEMGGVKEKLINYIFNKTISGRRIVEKRFWSLLEKSHSLKLIELEEKLLKFAEKHIQSLLYHEEFTKASSQIIKLVLSQKNLVASNSVKLSRIAQWKDSNRNLESLEQCVQDLLACVSFGQLAPREFYIIVSKYDDLLPGKDALDILMHLVDQKAAFLPKWCSSDDKLLNISPAESLNKLNFNLEHSFKTDKFKSVEDLRKMNDAKVVGNRRKLHGFQSQEDFRKLDDSKHLKDWGDRVAEAESYSKTLPESLYQMFEEGLFTDVNLYAKDGTKIPAHRLVLALGSDVFANMLYGTTPLKTLRLNETADELRTMLRHFYGAGEKFSIKTAKNLFDSLLRQFDIALRYECFSSKQVCWNVFHSTPISPPVFWKLLDKAKHLENYKVNTQLLMAYACTSPKKVFDDEAFYSASKNSVVQILEKDFLNMLECDILEYVARWLEINSKDFATDTTRKELFKYIRFEAINTDQFFAFLKLHDDLLLKEDAFAILTFLFREPKENGLPEWCYRGPLRSLHYDPLCKIGTDVLIPWKGKAEKGRNTFKCSYTATISNRRVESQLQFLELSWNVCLNSKGKHINHQCNITINHGDSEPLTFNDIEVLKNHRVIVPVFFTLSDKKPCIQFDIEVKTQAAFKYLLIRNQHKMSFENLDIKLNSPFNCLSDAIVDNCTSEHIKIPRYLLPCKTDSVLPTKNCFKIISEVTT